MPNANTLALEEDDSIAALRLLQPRQHEPSRTSWMIFEWIGAHLTRTHAAFMFLILPAIAFIMEAELYCESGVTMSCFGEMLLHCLWVSAGISTPSC